MVSPSEYEDASRDPVIKYDSPPSGVIAGQSPGAMYALVTIMTLLAMVAIGLRFYARRIKQTRLMWDDYMMLPAMVCHQYPYRSFYLLEQMKLKVA